jgi:hypothetical protein
MKLMIMIMMTMMRLRLRGMNMLSLLTAKAVTNSLRKANELAEKGVDIDPITGRIFKTKKLVSPYREIFKYFRNKSKRRKVNNLIKLESRIHVRVDPEPSTSVSSMMWVDA